MAFGQRLGHIIYPDQGLCFDQGSAFDRDSGIHPEAEGPELGEFLQGGIVCTFRGSFGYPSV